ncbi:MAG: NUDIX domain-containing protein [Alphaproteobacteria bacterium]|nr:NUDIX domain-containing protein [Alphaproteobacteria bacterium]
MSERKIDIIEKTAAFQGYFRIDRYRLRHSLHAGGMSAELTREVFERGHAVAVLPFDPVRDELVLIEQFRIGAHAAGKDPWITEIVAGIIDQGESIQSVAQRETIEETGLTARELWPMVRYLVSPGGATETVEMFLARVDSAKAGGIYGLDHEHEDIRVFTLPYGEVRDFVDSGRADNAMTLVALQWLMLHHDAVIARWGDGTGASEA